MNKQSTMRQWCMTDNASDFQSGESRSNRGCRITIIPSGKTEHGSICDTPR